MMKTHLMVACCKYGNTNCCNVTEATNSSLTSSPWVTVWRIKVVCSYLSCHLSHLPSCTVRKGDLCRSSKIFLSTRRPITLTNFWISGLAHTFSFGAATQLGSISSYIQSSLWKIPSDSLPNPLQAKPCLPKNLTEPTMWYSVCQLFSFREEYCCECSSLISQGENYLHNFLMTHTLPTVLKQTGSILSVAESFTHLWN